MANRLTCPVSSHPDSELFHRQAYGTPHPLQGYAANHHPGSSRQAGAWGPAGRTLGLSGLFDASLHHASPSGPDPSVMNLISALESRGPQHAPSASSLLSQFRTPSWQSAMHTSAPPELFISGALPGSSSFPSSSALSAYQHPGSFSGRSFTPSLSLQDVPTFSPTSNGLLSPHDPLLHIKTPSQSSLGYDRLLSSQSATYRGSQDSLASTQTQAPASSSNCHLPHPQFNLLSSQLHNQSSQLYNASMHSSTPALPPEAPSQPPSPPERAVSRQDSVIKHYQRSSPAHPTTLPLQQYVSCGGSSYQQIASHHRHAGVSCSPQGEQSPSSDPKPSSRMESHTYRPIIQTPYTSSSSSSSAPSSTGTKGAKNSSSSSGYSSSGSVSSSSRTPHTPPSASSTSSSSSSSTKASTASLSAPSRQQPPPQSVPAPPPLPVVSSTLVQQSTQKQCLSSYGSPSVANTSAGLPDQTPPQQHTQSYSPNQPPSAHIAQSYGGFNSPHAQDLSSGTGGTGGKAFTGIGTGGHSFSAEILFGDSSFGSASLRRAGSPPLRYGSAGESAGTGPVSGAPALGSGLGSVRSGSGTANVVTGNSSSYHLPESSPSPSISSTISRPGLNSPAADHPARSPGSTGANKYLSSILSPAFMSSPQGFHDTGRAQSKSYHASPPKPKTETNVLGVRQSQDEDDDDDDDDFLIHHLLNAQGSTSHPSQHHPSSQQLPQPLPEARDGEGKGMAFGINKISEERYHLQSVIRTNNTTNSSGPGTTIVDAASGLNNVQQTRQSQVPLSLMDSPPDQTEMLQSVLSHTTHNKMDPQQAPRQQHPLRQQAMMGSALGVGPAGVESHSQNQSSQLQLQLQTQGIDSHYSIGAQPRDQTQASQTSLDQLKQHQFETVNPECKVRHNQAQQQRFAPLTPVCFPDSLLNDEDRSFFPEMEDMFCSTDYKSSCVSGAGQAAQESLTQGHRHGQEGIDALKTGGAGEGYDMVGHHSDQGYGQYSHNVPETGNGNLHLEHDSMKTHELPSTVNTDQLGLIHSQTPTIGLNSAVQGDSTVNKMMGKNYAQEYEFEDDEDKADVPADIRLNSRRLPDLLPDLVSSCRKAGGAPRVGGLSPLMSDLDFCHPTSYSALGNPPQLLPHDGPKKRGRKPTKPKREGPPRPRGRPRIRPLPEPPYCKGLMGSVAGESKRGRGRGRGRGKREEGLCHQDPVRPIKIKLPSPSESLLRTDSLSSTEPVLSDGSVGSAPSLGLSPRSCATTDISRNELNQVKDKMMKHQQKAGEFKKRGFRCSTGSVYRKKQTGADSTTQHCVHFVNITRRHVERRAGGWSCFSVVLASWLADEKAFDFKPGFMASFLDFLKTGKKQPGLDSGHDGGAMEPLNPCSSMKGGIMPLSPPPPPLPQTPPQQPPGTFSEDGQGEGEDLALSGCPSPCKPLDEELKRNLETLPSFSSDEEDSVSKNQDLQKSISSAISALYDTPHSLAADQEPEAGPPSPSSPSSSSPSSMSSPPPSPPTPEEVPPSQRLTSLHLAKKQTDAAIAGESEEEDSQSGGEGIFRERDEFVVRTEDIGTLKMALQTGREPPPIWRVQKALLQKFSPEIKDGQRQFCATSNYLGYFGDAKMRYQRLYVKFLENINKKDYVRVCSRKPWHRAGLTLREGGKRDGSVAFERREEKRAKTSRDKAEPPLKKRKKWLKEGPSSPSESDSSPPSDEEGPVRGGVNSRAMREMFRSYVEMLVSTALDPDMIQALEDTDDELYLPPMRKIDSLLSEQKKRLLRRVNMSAQHQEALQIFPKMTADPLESGAIKVHLGGEGYNRKTLNRARKSIPRQQDLKLSIEICRVYSLYHSLHHYKYHTFLHCKKETDSIEQAAEDPGQEEVVQQCMANQGWLESLFNSFMELLNLSAKA
ncbi:DUF4211 domain containing protein [Scophthalmus maximus]|uniref:DUF4211 domain containing protein n=1 Tax=Scophthalmus maximus TaxID=52904 RepID=A0A2U9CQ50_SCOMX|nr:DUF4211 domain containing protein [Scophthalmus maximus]